MTRGPPAVSQLPTSCRQPDAILFPDTCALLDIVRLPLRAEPAKIHRELVAIEALLQCATRTSSRLSIVIAPPVNQEWIDNVGSVLSELNRTMQGWCDRGESLAEVQKHFGLSQLQVQSAAVLAPLTASLEQLARALMGCAHSIAEDETAMVRAMRRVSQAQAPARRGGQAKDCMVLEHVFRAIATLASDTPGCRFVFLSSNVSDYCESKGVMRAPLDQEFKQFGLSFVTDWAWARQALAV